MLMGSAGVDKLTHSVFADTINGADGDDYILR